MAVNGAFRTIRRALEAWGGITHRPGDFGATILINNAGIFLESDAKPSIIDLQLVRQTYDTNVFGAMAMIQAMLPLLLRSSAGRVVNVSTSVGSLTLGSDPKSQWSKLAMLGY